MKIDPSKLLKRLEPAVRPVGGASAPQGRRPIEQQGFDELLTLVSTGAVRSEQPIHVPEHLADSFDDAQRERLGSAADTAEAAGAERALMLIDGRGVTMDIKQRAVTAELKADSNTLVHVDAAVYVAGDESAEQTGARGPRTGLVPMAVASQLEAAAEQRQSADDQTHQNNTAKTNQSNAA